MKPITKQLIIAVFILALVTVASLGIRQVRFRAGRTTTVENPIFAEPEPDPIPAVSDTVAVEPEPEHVEVSEPGEEEPSEVKPSKGDYAKAKSFKKDVAKAKGSKDLERISLSDYENLYRTKKGGLWYVSKQPDGKTVKMQVHIDETTGEITLVDAKSGGSQNLQKISLGDYENLYITEEGEQWYVSEQPDGSASKSRVLFDDTTGEITVIDDYSTSDKGQDGAGKD